MDQCIIVHFGTFQDKVILKKKFLPNEALSKQRSQKKRALNIDLKFFVDLMNTKVICPLNFDPV